MVQLTARGKLIVDEEQRQILLETMELVNQVRNYLSEVAFRERVANKVKLQKIGYREARERFSIPAQYVVRAIASVCNAYKSKKKNRWKEKVEFRAYASIDLDQRLVSFKGIDKVSINTVKGRLTIPVVWGEYFNERIAFKRGHSKLIYKDGEFYIAVVVELPEGSVEPTKGCIGIDVGIKNMAVDSFRNFYGGEGIIKKRLHYREKRGELQKKLTQRKKEGKDTRSVRRALKRIRRKERNFMRTKSHEVAKGIVSFAKALSFAIAMENLKGIRERATAKGKQNQYLLHSWNFRLLQSLISYKAKLYGVPIVFVEPQNTSRTCPICGHISKNNRKTQEKFKCEFCGFGEHADFVGAINIAFKGLQSTSLMPPDGQAH
ncbi:MAG: transposase [Thermoproteota archaeon]